MLHVCGGNPRETLLQPPHISSSRLCCHPKSLFQRVSLWCSENESGFRLHPHLILQNVVSGSGNLRLQSSIKIQGLIQVLRAQKYYFYLPEPSLDEYVQYSLFCSLYPSNYQLLCFYLCLSTLIYHLSTPAID